MVDLCGHYGREGQASEADHSGAQGATEGRVFTPSLPSMLLRPQDVECRNRVQATAVVGVSRRRPGRRDEHTEGRTSAIVNDREHQGGERFLIELEALSDDHPPIRRLRHFLKSALRTWRLKCRSIVETTPYPTPDARSPLQTRKPRPTAISPLRGKIDARR